MWPRQDPLPHPGQRGDEALKKCQQRGKEARLPVGGNISRNENTVISPAGAGGRGDNAATETRQTSLTPLASGGGA